MNKQTIPALQGANKSKTDFWVHPDASEWSLTLLNARSNQVKIAAEWWKGEDTRVIRIYAEIGGWMEARHTGFAELQRVLVDTHDEEVIQFDTREDIDNFINLLIAARDENWPGVPEV